MKKAVCKVNEQKVSKQKASATRFVVLDSLLGLPRAPLVGALQGNRTPQGNQKKFNRSRSLSLDSPNRKRAEGRNVPVVPVLPEGESTVIRADNLES